MIIEYLTLRSGKKVKRIKVSVLLSLAFLSIPVGFLLLLYGEFGSAGFLILFLAPFLIVYVLIRELFFAGKDSITAVVTSIVVEEVLKHDLLSNKQRKNKRN